MDKERAEQHRRIIAENDRQIGELEKIIEAEPTRPTIPKVRRARKMISELKADSKWRRDELMIAGRSLR